MTAWGIKKESEEGLAFVLIYLKLISGASDHDDFVALSEME